MSLLDMFTNAAKAVADPAGPIVANATAALKAAVPAVAAAAMPGLGPAPTNIPEGPTGLAAVKIGWQGGVVIATLFVSLIVMGMDLIGPDLVFGLLAAIYMVSGIITVKEGAAGFSNTGVLTVLALYIVAEGVSQTGGLDILMNKVLGRANSVFWAQVRMMIPVMISSAFLNNTPIVALLIPILMSWARRCGVPAKKLLIPLSFATVLGGTCTLIGTSTNLVVSGLQEEMARRDPDIPVFKFFTITPYGVPYAAWGMAYILLFSWLLPGHEGAGETDLVSELTVDKSSKTAGTTLGASGLLDAEGSTRVIGVRSANGTPVLNPHVGTVLHPGDVIIVQGSAHDNQQFATHHGLSVLLFEGGDAAGADGSRAEDGSVTSDDGEASLTQANVAANSDLIGRSIRDIGFRGRFDAAVIAVKRNDVKQSGRLGDLVLAKGDILVLATGPSFDPKNADFAKNFKRVKFLDKAVQREYTTAMKVVGSTVAGKTIQSAGLRGINGLFLFEIHRVDGEVLSAVGPDTVLQEGDTLYFAGDLASVTFLMKFTGLEHQQQSQLRKLNTHQVDRHLVQAVVSHSSPLIHKSVREVRFRHTYGAAVLSVHRSGQTLTGDTAAIKLQAGDVLVIEAGPEFSHIFQHSPAFALINEVPNSAPVKKNRMYVALFLVGALVATQIVAGAIGKEFLHLWPGSMLVVGLMLLTRCLNATQARQSMDFEVFICIAFAFAVSGAMEKTQVALGVAELFAALSRHIGGQTAALTCMYLVTALLSELLTNNAAAAIMFPIAANLAKSLGINMDMMSIAVMLGGSAGWILPYSYQCNLMVQAAGGYRTVDFVKFGAPFHPWLLVGVILILGSGNKVYIPLIITGAFTALVVILPLIYERCLSQNQQASIKNSLRGLFGIKAAPGPAVANGLYIDAKDPNGYGYSNGKY